MILCKCPRCELNYILDGGVLCSVCRDQSPGNWAEDDASQVCSVCGERAARPGEDLCGACLREMRPGARYAPEEPDPEPAGNPFDAEDGMAQYKAPEA